MTTQDSSSGSPADGTGDRGPNTGTSGAGYGLAVRWRLDGAPPDHAEQLREYVVGTSMARFRSLDGLAFKTWRMRPGEWFDGVYVFGSEERRTAFRETFEATMADAPVSQVVGSAPVLVEEFEVVAVVAGPTGFSEGAGPGR